MQIKKTCRYCDVLKSLDQYHVHVNYRDNHDNVCKECRKQQQRARYERYRRSYLEQNASNDEK